MFLAKQADLIETATLLMVLELNPSPQVQRNWYLGILGPSYLLRPNLSMSKARMGINLSINNFFKLMSLQM